MASDDAKRSAIKTRRSPLTLSPATLGAATVGLIAADWGSRLAGDSLFPGGPLDETAHFLTTLLVLWALGPRVYERFLWPALIVSVLIDADHVPALLGVGWLTEGTPRPYTHSLLAIGIFLLLALFWRRRRDPLLGLAVGLAIHFWRDLAELNTGVSLLWPFTDRSFAFARGLYLAVMGAVTAIDLVRCHPRPVSLPDARRCGFAAPAEGPVRRLAHAWLGHWSSVCGRWVSRRSS